MNREALIQQTLDAGGEYRGQYDLHQFTSEELERFAAAIRAATKEEDAKIFKIVAPTMVAVQPTWTKPLSAQLKPSSQANKGESMITTQKLVDEIRDLQAQAAGKQIQLCMLLEDREGAERAQREMYALIEARQAAAHAFYGTGCYFQERSEVDSICLRCYA